MRQKPTVSKKAQRSILGWSMMFAGFYLALWFGGIYWALHPHLTHMQLLLQHWPWLLVAVGLLGGGYVVVFGR